MKRLHAAPSLLALSAALLATPAWSQGAAHPQGSYLGLSLGQSRARLDSGPLVQRQLGLLDPGTLLTGQSSDERDRALRLFLGYQFNRNWAAELGVMNLGRFGTAATLSPPGQLDGRLRVQGGSLDLVGSLPLGDRVDLLLRGGVVAARTRARFDGSGSAAAAGGSIRDRKVGGKFGAGLQLALGSSLLMRVEAEQYRVPNAMDGTMRLRVYSVSAVLPLGKPASSSRSVAAAPVRWEPPLERTPAAVEPPAPMVVQAPPPERSAPLPPPPLRQYSFAAEALFAFNRAELQPAGEQALDGLARELNGTRFDEMRVEGHADRLGGSAYNQQLSQQRAEVVKGYLVERGGLEAGRISATGYGESRPQTQPQDCRTGLAQAALRSCLQPDRRVDVVVNGMR